MNDRTTSIFHIISSYYCFECHLDELHVIPSKVIHNWDLSKYKGILSKLYELACWQKLKVILRFNSGETCEAIFDAN